MRAVNVANYRTPELAYTSAAVCLLELDPTETEIPKQYFSKALAIRNNYPPALLRLERAVETLPASSVGEGMRLAHEWRQ